MKHTTRLIYEPDTETYTSECACGWVSSAQRAGVIAEKEGTRHVQASEGDLAELRTEIAAAIRTALDDFRSGRTIPTDGDYLPELYADAVLAVVVEAIRSRRYGGL